MIPFLRSQFNAHWTSEKHQAFLKLLVDRFGEPSPFPLSETPVFLSAELVAQAADAGQELVQQLLENPDYQSASQQAIPEAWRTPNENPHPMFIQADFGLDADKHLKLVEIQGFPSLYAFQPILSDAYREAFSIDPALASLPGGLSRHEYSSLLRQAIVANHYPENVALLEIDPDHQKTRQDFRATADLFGISIIDVRSVTKRGNRLYYERKGKQVPIERIYNRVIADELERRRIELPFSFQDELQVEWAGHPNWFYRLSKFSLPYLHHPVAPECFFLDQMEPVDDLENYVLKPLYSFAGAGVVIGPSQDLIDDIPEDRRDKYILQRRVDFYPWIETPVGPTKMEIRVMYIWLDKLQPVNLIIRTGRGSQMGVDHNKGLGWVGASAAFIETEEDK